MNQLVKKMFEMLPCVDHNKAWPFCETNFNSCHDTDNANYLSNVYVEVLFVYK